jgi:protein SCO1
MTLRAVRWLLWGLVAVAALAFAWLALRPAEPEPVQMQTVQQSLGGPFTLVGADGRAFPSSRLNNRPHAIFFGFTNCPDVCPTALARMAKLRRQAGGEDAFDILFITVDPRRDGPTEVGRYAALFGTPVIGLTGSPAQIAQVKKQYGIFSQEVPDGAGSYSVDHSAAVLLFDRKGGFVATITPEEGDGVALEKLRRIVA